MRLVSIHTMDPRGTKVGGIETHVRQIVKHHPAHMRVLFVGTDETGDLEIGKIVPLSIAGRAIDFLPLLRVEPDMVQAVATSIGTSITFRFARALLAHLRTIRRAIAGEPASVEIERFEFAPVARLLGRKLVVLNHNEFGRGDRMDSLLSRHMWMHETAEWIAYRLSSRIFCVTEKLRDAVAIKHPGQAGKAEHLSVSVDPDVFAPTPFDTADGVLRIVYAGRLDAFKDPELMFEAARRLHARLGGKFEFHYCGAADPHRFPQFAAIEPFTVRHGALTPDGVAKVMARVHMGWLTSHFEGMPCFLLELLASGRPFTGLRLPQFDKVVRPGVSGLTTDRTDDRDETADNVAATAAELWARIRAGAIDPQAVAASIVPFTVANQLSRLFQAHEALAFGGRATPARDAAQTA